MNESTKFGTSQTSARVEDLRFLTGNGRYLDDSPADGALHAYFFRSPVAHASISKLDLEAAREAEGVALALTCDDIEAAGVEISTGVVLTSNRDGTPAAAPLRPFLARGRVRFVGEPVALIVADSPNRARDAAELVEFEYEELDAALGLESPSGATDGAVGGNGDCQDLHDEAPGNRAFDWALGDEAATEAAFASADRTVALDVWDNRIISNSMEPRGCIARMEGDRLHFAFSGQGVFRMKERICAALGMDASQVRVTTPDVGGGFGTKVMAYPEYFSVALAARQIGRPVRWIPDRNESMLSDNAGRDLVSRAEFAFDADRKVTAYRVRTRCNLGAYNSQMGQQIQTDLFARVLAGAYDIQTTFLQVEGRYTNTTQTDAYRGAGRPEAIYVLERLMDRAARELGMDPWELRRRNFIPPDAFPYVSATGETYDVGDFARVLERAGEACDRKGFAARRSADAERGLLRGQGLCYYIESILGDPSEGAKVEFDADGGASVFVGTQSNGQGHETVYSSFLSARTGIPMEAIRVVQGDSDRIADGGGTGGSRSVTTQTNAAIAVVKKMVAAFGPFLAGKMGVDDSSVEFDGERFRAPGSNLAPTFLEAADMARVDGRADLLVHEARATLPGRSYPNGAHVAEVVVDPETGAARVDRYVVTDDFGTLVHPTLAEGQVHGGVAQGIGQAMLEHVVHDETGQLLTASFMDYAMPRASDIPFVSFNSEPVPSTANPLGMKGCGEAGTVGALAAVANAVQDALWERGVRDADMPFTPHRVWNMLRRGASRNSTRN